MSERRPIFPHVDIDRGKKVVEVAAVVVFDPARHDAVPTPEGAAPPRRGGWLELVATTPGMREHEALVAVRARPRHIHQALIMVGLVPGSPYRAVVRGDEVKVLAPHGPPVEVSFCIQQDGRTTEVPVGAWIVDRRTGLALRGNRWHFAGSNFRHVEGRELYLADLNGTVVSLVQFGDDLLCRPTALTHRDDGQVFAANLETLPPPGTVVTLRLRVASRAAPGGPTSRPAPASQPVTRTLPAPNRVDGATQ